VAGVVGLAEALVLAQPERSSESARLWSLTRRLLDELPRRVDGCRITGHPMHRLPGHASCVMDDIESVPLLVGLDRRDIWASNGSACTSAVSEPSHVLLAMGVPRRSVFGALRFTFGLDNCAEDVDTLLEVLPELVAAARPAELTHA
jgi:cysteine desulfurase